MKAAILAAAVFAGLSAAQLGDIPKCAVSLSYAFLQHQRNESPLLPPIRQPQYSGLIILLPDTATMRLRAVLGRRLLGLRHRRQVHLRERPVPVHRRLLPDRSLLRGRPGQGRRLRPADLLRPGRQGPHRRQLHHGRVRHRHRGRRHDNPDSVRNRVRRDHRLGCV